MNDPTRNARANTGMTVADLGVPHLGLTIRVNGWQGILDAISRAPDGKHIALGWQGILDAISRAPDGKHIALRVGGVATWVKPNQPVEVIP